MAKKILILEDNLYTAEDMYTDINSALQKHDLAHIELIMANSIDEANSKLCNIDKKDLICIIADLNMDPDGLTDEQKQKTQGAVLTGWIWVHSYVWQEAELQKKHVIFYSAFTNILRKNKEFQDIENKRKKNVKLFNKSEYNINDLCKEIIVLCK